eukprot:CAMPEP_0194372026 /NCGR_PEP_ID=MMETSP0174-20130528/20324_1 /TAXON_ID=216777 /ORGANISM="Proboscia alata, Strain PI-D3" /LENGTH=192 /DNA_ID=CAMNT_0039150291 /DNA_START=116 /DNA_END=691 /DNA_ORIENTATION=-
MSTHWSVQFAAHASSSQPFNNTSSLQTTNSNDNKNRSKGGQFEACFASGLDLQNSSNRSSSNSGGAAAELIKVKQREREIALHERNEDERIHLLSASSAARQRLDTPDSSLAMSHSFLGSPNATMTTLGNILSMQGDVDTAAPRKKSLGKQRPIKSLKQDVLKSRKKNIISGGGVTKNGGRNKKGVVKLKKQ